MPNSQAVEAVAERRCEAQRSYLPAPKWDELGDTHPLKNAHRRNAARDLELAEPFIRKAEQERIREALKGPVARLERIRDLDEQTSDGALGSLARHALDEIAASLDSEQVEEERPEATIRADERSRMEEALLSPDAIYEAQIYAGFRNSFDEVQRPTFEQMEKGIKGALLIALRLRERRVELDATDGHPSSPERYLTPLIEQSSSDLHKGGEGNG